MFTDSPQMSALKTLYVGILITVIMLAISIYLYSNNTQCNDTITNLIQTIQDDHIKSEIALSGVWDQQKSELEELRKQNRELLDMIKGVDSHLTSASLACQPTHDQDTFYAIAKKEGIDKVTDHHYESLYDKYLPLIRTKKVKMLEIGLGCNMVYGPGHSLTVWNRYFKTNGLELHSIEVEKACAAMWIPRITDATIHVGSQNNVTFLGEVIAKTGGQFDLVVDDGGHTMNQQKTSFATLFDTVRPGGFYIIEDLQTSFRPEFIDENPTTLDWIKTLLDAFYKPNEFPSYVQNIFSFECYHEICIFVKKK